jgi:hypothetical protein
MFGERLMGRVVEEDAVLRGLWKGRGKGMLCG